MEAIGRVYCPIAWLLEMSEYCAEKGSALMCMWERPLTFVPLYTAFVALSDGYRSSPTTDSNASDSEYNERLRLVR